MLAAVITSTSFRRALEDIKIAETEDADLVELRLDYIKNLNIVEKIIKKCKTPIILTDRQKNFNEPGFLDFFKELKNSGIRHNIKYLDFEYPILGEDIKKITDIIELKRSKNKINVIISYHNFEETPDNITEIYNNIKKLNPDLIKIVTNAASVTDNFKIFDLIKASNKEGRKLIAFCMGPYGQFSRVLSITMGSQITYSSIAPDKESAPSQMTLNEMNDIYRIKTLNKHTSIFGLIGDPIEHSWSHIIHNAAFDSLNMNSVYLKFRVDKLKEFITYFRKLNIAGFSVTIPHKVEVIKYLDWIDDKSRAIGAVNTIVVKEKEKDKDKEPKRKLIGYNTDCDGAIKAIKSKTEIKGTNVVVLGAGGTARALTYGLMKEGANITILNRTVNKAKSIAVDFGCDFGTLSKSKDIDYDILVNTTPIGMFPYISDTPIKSGKIKKNTFVFDAIYNPYKTRLIIDAEKRGCTTIPGFEMLINGAVLQFKLWSNKDCPEELIRKKLEEILGYKDVTNKN